MDQMETQRYRALLLASRNQLDALWRLADSNANERGRVESVLKLIGAIDYALGIEPYTLDLDGIASEPAPAPAATHRGAGTPAGPLDIE